MKFFFILLILLPALCIGQIQYDFEDGSIDGWTESNPGSWESSTVDPIDGSYSLKHSYDNASGATEYVSTSLCPILLESGITTWQFQVRHAYDPSSGNNWAVFLYTDQDALSASASTLSGYAIGVNYSGSSDLLSLWKVENGVATEIISSTVNWQTEITTTGVCGIKVTRSSSGYWEIYADTNGGFDNLILQGSITDNSINSGNNFLISYEYTSSADMKLWFDDLTIESTGYNTSIDYDSEISDPQTQVSGDNIPSTATTAATAVDVFSFSVSDLASSDALPTEITELNIKNANPSNSALWESAIAGVILSESGGSDLNINYTISNSKISIFPQSGSMNIPGGTNKEFTLSIYLSNEQLTDGSVLQFQIPASNHGCLANSSGSQLSCNFTADVLSSVFTIDVSSTQLIIDNYPSLVGSNKAFSCTVKAIDANNNLDTDFSGLVTLSVGYGDGSLSSSAGLSQNLSSGQFTWSDLTYDDEGYFKISVQDNAASLNSGLSYYINSIVFPETISDNFSDGDFTNNPVWTGDENDFIIDPTRLWLQSFPPDEDPDTSYLATYIDPIVYDLEWQFYINLDFDPSSNNFVRYYLISDNQTLTASLNGYFIQFGETGSTDAIELFRQDGNAVSSVCRAADGLIANSPEVRIKVRKSAGGEWKIYADYSGNNILSQIATGTDNTYSFDYFCLGPSCIHLSSSYNEKFFFDDIYAGPYIIDSLPPEVTEVRPVASNRLNVYFNEGVELFSAESFSHYSLDGTSLVDVERDQDNYSIVHLTFADDFPVAEENYLTITDIEDFEGNLLTSVTKSFYLYYPKTFDIIIDEIMTDVNPEPLQLPAEEYIELVNTSEFPINLEDWYLQLKSGGSKLYFSEVTLEPDSFLIVCNDLNKVLFSSYGQTVGLNGFSLYSESDLTLFDNNNELIHTVSYSSDFYHDRYKEDGGWSMEMVDITNPCEGENNWKASDDSRGGTPGMVNSVEGSNADYTIPEIIRAGYISNDTVMLHFSESLHPELLYNKNAYYADQNMGNPSTVFPYNTLNKDIVLVFDRDFGTDTIYNIFVLDSITDCAGNAIVNESSVRFAIPDSVLGNEFIINEVLTNPLSGSSDFVELFNIVNYTIDLQDIIIANRDIETDLLDDIEKICNESFLFFPGDFVVLTEDVDDIQVQYYVKKPSSLLETDLPTYADDTACIVLMDRAENIIDELYYGESMHFQFLSSFDGVSLERISYTEATQSFGNWNSASESAGWGTPTYENSQYNDDFSASDEEFYVDPKVFSPDNDGFEDRLYVNYNVGEGAYVGKIYIFDSKGRLVRKIADNEYITGTGSVYWDGLDETNKRCKLGIYIAFAEFFDEKGEIKKYKKTFVLGGKL